MHDNKLKERMKNFQAIGNHDILKSRLDNSLRLRKEHLFDNLMKKRLGQIDMNEIEKFKINSDLLNVNPIMKETYQEADTSEKFDYLTKWLTEYDTSSKFGIMNDDRKYALCQLRLLSEDLELEPNQDIEIESDLIQVLLYEFYDSQETCVKFEISLIFLNFSFDSNKLNLEIGDADCLLKFTELTYCNCIPIIENLLLIMNNTIMDTYKEYPVEFLISNVPLIQRIKEIMISIDIIKNESLRNSCLYLLRSLIINTNSEKYILYIDFLIIFARLFETNSTGNLETLSLVLLILSQLSRDEKNIIGRIIECDIITHIFEVLNRKSLERDFVLNCIRIIGNMCCGDDIIVDYIFNFKPLQTFEKILNSYKNTVQPKDKIILHELIWAISNIVATSEKHVLMFIQTKLPKSILSLYKHKNCNKLVLESLHLFFNALNRGSDNSCIEILNMKLINLVCDSINYYDNNEVLYMAFECILSMIKISMGIFKTHLNIKNELLANNSMIKIEKCQNHINEDISKKALRIISVMSREDDYCSQDMDCEMNL